MLYIFFILIIAMLSFFLASSIAKHAGFYYLGLVVLCYVSIAGIPIDLPGFLTQAFIVIFRRGTLVAAIFTVVMVIGALPPDSTLSKRLRPLRSELSIMGCILGFSHIAAYAPSFMMQGFNALGRANVTVSMSIAIILTILLVILGITSLNSIKCNMRSVTWKRIQKTAYVFFYLMLLHAIAMLLPSLASGNIWSIMTVCAYILIGAVYGCMRVARSGDANRRASTSRGY